jgi:hypothetical protein
MNRWTQTALAGLALAASTTFAQGVIRTAPADVKPAIIAVSATPPVITVNGQADRLSPGARIRDLNNMMVLPATVAGKSLYTVYRRDAAGLVSEVWVLTANEYAKVGGVNTDSADGYKRFNDLLNLIWQARSLLLLK